jgi:hypothetical protein
MLVPMTDQILSPAERAALLDRYRDGADHFIAAMDNLSDAELDARPFEGEWTVREICHHLADGELNSAVRLRRLIAEDEPMLPGYDEMAFSRRLHYGERAIGPSLAAMAAARAATYQILVELSEAEWARNGTHSEHGPYGVEAWLRDYADHPWDHAEQARRVLDAAGRA